MDKLTYQEAAEYLRNFNRKYGYTTKGNMDHICTMVAVITSSSFTDANGKIVPYSLESRSYAFTNCNKAFIDGQIGYSIFADSLDHTDSCRLEQYLVDEKGGPDGWIVDYCYIKDET